MTAHALLRASLLATCCLLVACGDDDSASMSAAGSPTPQARVIDRDRVQALLASDYLRVGEGLDAPGRLEFDLPVIGRASGPCADNTRFRVGSGLHDITGPVVNVGGAGWEDPAQVISGLHIRQYARAFAIASPCDGRQLIFVSADIGLMFGSVRQGVLRAVATDPVLKTVYGPDNIMLSATHTHQGPAGYGHHDAFNAFHFGHDALVLATIVDGIVKAIRQAHDDLLASPGTAPIRLAVDELLNTNVNRSAPAFAMNPEAERREFLNRRGEEIQVNKRVIQLNLARADGRSAGIINWFGVHPTSIGQKQTLVSGDHKGLASRGFERLMGTRYDALPGSGNFVAAFAQKDEGDASPNLFIRQFPTPDPRRGGGRSDLDNAVIAGSKQLAKAVSLFERGTPLRGPLDYRFTHVRFDQVEVSDPVVLAGLRHPAELDSARKRTCTGALGVSFGGGAEDGPGPTVEGISCNDSPDVIAAAQRDFAAGSAGKIPPALLSTGVLCQLDALPALDLGCHAEKPVLFVVGGPAELEPSVLPLQIFRLGNLALVGVPWEVTTMSARRLRKTLMAELAPVGIDTIVIAGLVNDYSHYLTTREEYASQQYEGGSTIFGPWSLAAVQQELRRVALSLRAGTPLPAGPAYEDVTPRLLRPPYLPADLPGPDGRFGALLANVPASARTGDTVQASFRAGHPRNDLRLQASYVHVEREVTAGRWQVIAEDRDPELLFRWRAAVPSPLPLDLLPAGQSTADAIWTIPCSTPPGRYRLRHAGSARLSPLLPATAYEGVSGVVTVTRAPDCRTPDGLLPF